MGVNHPFGKNSFKLGGEGEVKVYTSPNPINTAREGYRKSIFLAGTIDNGDSENWQDTVIGLYEARAKENRFAPVHYDIYNPRRESWLPYISQNIADPVFYQQVAWELDAMDKADYILMVFLADSKSPVTMLELGLFATTKKLRVVCPDEFWRSGNVHFICNKYNIPLYKSIEELEI